MLSTVTRCLVYELVPLKHTTIYYRSLMISTNQLRSAFPIKSARDSSVSSNEKLHQSKLNEIESPNSVTSLDPTVPTGTPTVPLPPPKRSLKEQIVTFYKAMWRDYRDVFKENYEESKNKPKKTIVYGIIFGTMGYLLWSNPSESDFHAEFFENRNMLSLVGKPIRNPISEEYCNNISRLEIKGQLRYQSFGFFSIVWRHDNPECAGSFECTCKYLKPIITEAKERFIDVGLGDRWWITDKRMEDYDVNEREWDQLPNLVNSTNQNVSA